MIPASMMPEPGPSAADLRRLAPKVIGLDLSITATGVALADGTAETWKLPASWGDRRLFEIQHRVGVQQGIEVIDLVVIEDLPTHAKSAGITGMVHGAVRSRLVGSRVPYALVTPATLKAFATGRGNAGKPEMAVALFKRTGQELADDNMVDAVWLRYAGLAAYGQLPFDLPAAQLARLDKVQWPETVGYRTAVAA